MEALMPNILMIPVVLTGLVFSLFTVIYFLLFLYYDRQPSTVQDSQTVLARYGREVFRTTTIWCAVAALWGWLSSAVFYYYGMSLLTWMLVLVVGALVVGTTKVGPRKTFRAVAKVAGA